MDTFPITNGSYRYELQALVELGDRRHKHAVAYVQSTDKTWRNFSDEVIAESTSTAAHHVYEYEQVLLLFCQKLCA
jgi:hypothetical protein